MLWIIVALLVGWLVLAVIGAVIEGLFWLFVIGALLFVVTAAVGWTKGRTGTRV